MQRESKAISEVIENHFIDSRRNNGSKLFNQSRSNTRRKDLAKKPPRK